MLFKKVLAGVLAAVVAVGSLSISAFADTDASGDFKYEVLDDGTVSIIKYLGDDENVVIPDTIDDMKVTEIGRSAFGYNDYIVTVEIPDSVTTIRLEAFWYCTSLIEVVIPNSVETIGNAAFYYCTSLTEIIIPDSVIEIGDLAFFACISLTSIDVKENNTNYTSVDGVLFNKNLSTLIQYPIGRQNTEYIIPDSVTTIGESAFQYCYFLTDIVIPDSVTTIEYVAFEYCTSLTEIVIPDSVTKIGNWAFRSCTSLTSIFVKENNNNYTSADGVLFDKNITTLIQYPIGRQNTKYTIPDGVIRIEASAFYNCAFLTEIVIPESVTEIEFDASFFDWPSDLIIYGYTGSIAESLANEYYNIKFVALDQESETPSEPSEEPITLEDKSTGITVTAADGVIPEGAVLTVKADEESSTDTAAAFDITLTVDGKPADIDGTVTVTIPVPEELKGAAAYYVFYQAEDGTLTDMKAAYKDGVLTFTTTHFSTYIVSTVNLLSDNGSTDTDEEDKNQPTGVTLLIIPSLTAAAAAVISKKRK